MTEKEYNERAHTDEQKGTSFLMGALIVLLLVALAVMPEARDGLLTLAMKLGERASMVRG